MISKDQSIVTQVAAKIAADLIVKDTNTMSNIAEWLIAFDAVSEALNNAHGFTTEPAADPLPGPTETPMFRASAIKS